MLCTFRQRCRQTPQRSNRRPNRSMWTIMYRSVSSTFVTVCDFNPRLLSEKRFDEHLDPLPFDGLITITLKGLDESGIQTAYSDGNLLHPKPFNLNCTFWIRTRGGAAGWRLRPATAALDDSRQPGRRIRVVAKSSGAGIRCRRAP